MVNRRTHVFPWKYFSQPISSAEGRTSSNHLHERTKRALLAIEVIVSVLLLVGSCWAAEAFQVVVERNVRVRMRDGVTLQADIYRPKDPGKFPVLLQRTPYNRYSSSDFPQDFDFEAAARGYVVIVQDSRGRFGSEGDWYPFKYDGNDGYDTVEWAANLPFSNG
jgi:predicted acyl esterase